VAVMAQAFRENAEFSVGAMMPALLVGDAFAVTCYGRHSSWRRLLGLLPYVAVGLVAGYVVLRIVNGNELRPVLGWLILAMFLLEILRRRLGWIEMPDRLWFVLGVGVLSGFGTMVGNAAGPVMTMYLLSQRLPKHEFVGTCAWFFLIVNLLKVIPFLSEGMITSQTLRFAVAAVPATLAGVAAGLWAFRRIPQQLFDTLVLILAGAAGVWMVVA